MEEEGSVATSCMAVARFLPGCAEFPTALCNDPLFTSSPATTPVDSSNTSDAVLMGNLLTDMLSSDFPYSGSTSSRFSVPEILQFPANADHHHHHQASKMTLLQMLEESDTSSPYASLKLPVLEELSGCSDQRKLLTPVIHQSSCSQAPETLVFPPAPASAPAPIPSTPPPEPSTGLQANGMSTAELDHLKPCKVEPDSTTPPAIHLSSANSDSCSSDIKLRGGGGPSQSTTTSSGGTDLTTPPPGQHEQTQAQNPNQNQRPKRKRTKSSKNSQEVESQRQTHIAVERNRRKQMNEHLNVLRSLMPGSYVQRGDQASIIGGAIEFVKELEQLLQCLQAQKRRRMYSEAFGSPKPSPTTVSSILHQHNFTSSCNPPPASNSAYNSALIESPTVAAGEAHSKFVNDNFYYDPSFKESIVQAEVKSEAADVEVKLVNASDAVVKILSQRRPGQLLKTISALENLCMSIVHTNITTIEQTVLYSFTVKLAMEPRLGVEEIAEAVQRAFSLFHNSNSTTSSTATVA